MRKANKSRQSKQKHTCPHRPLGDSSNHKIPSNAELGNALADFWEILKYIQEDVWIINKKLDIEGHTTRALKLYNSLAKVSSLHEKKRGSSNVKASSHRETYVSSESESDSSTESDTSDDEFVPEKKSPHPPKDA